MKFSSPLVFGLGLGLGITVGVSAVIGAGQLGSSIFPDVPAGAYYDQAVGKMYSLGIITGFGDGTFKPEDNATRGQIAVINERTIDYIFDELNHTPSQPDKNNSSTSVSSTSDSSTSASSTSTSASSTVTVPEEGGFRFTTTNYNVNEDDGQVTITVVRTGGSTGLVGVQYAVTADTATADEDFELTSGTLNFAAGETSNQFDVPIINDTAEEGDETFTLTLSDPAGGAVLTSPIEATVTIKDDEEVSGGDTGGGGEGNPNGTFNFSALTYAVAEDGLSAVITVDRVGGSQGSVTVGYNMTDGTADSGDYNKDSGTLTFAAGETSQTFNVNQKENDEVNGNKTVNLALNTPTGGAVLGDNKTAVLTIFDDDIAAYGSGSFRFSDDEYEVVESDGDAIITIERIKGADGDVTVKFETYAGSATAGVDYEDVDVTLNFLTGESAKVVTIPVLNDTANDNNETVNLKLKEPSGRSDLTTPSIATLRIY